MHTFWRNLPLALWRYLPLIFWRDLTLTLSHASRSTVLRDDDMFHATQHAYLQSLTPLAWVHDPRHVVLVQTVTL